MWGRRVQIVFFPIVFILFFVLGPGLLVYRHVRLPMDLPPAVRLCLGFILAGIGVTLYLWTILLFAKTQGTQVPIAPTQALVTTGPYAVSRNPMVTGTVIMVLGAGFLFGSWSFMLAGLVPPVPYLIYIKVVEERELEARFGEEYVSYKRSTPFILPRLWKKHK